MGLGLISCSPYQRHSLCEKLLVLSSDYSRGGNNELSVCKNIEYRNIRIIFGPVRYFASKRRVEILVPFHLYVSALSYPSEGLG